MEPKEETTEIPIVQRSLDLIFHALLPKDKKFAMKNFIATARRLHSEGTCIMDGSFSISKQQFYYTYKDTSSPSGASVVSYRLTELD